MNKYFFCIIIIDLFDFNKMFFEKRKDFVKSSPANIYVPLSIYRFAVKLSSARRNTSAYINDQKNHTHTEEMLEIGRKKTVPMIYKVIILMFSKSKDKDI